MEKKQSLLSEADIAALEAFYEGSSGYFYRMLEYLEQFIESGIRAGRFTEEEAREDLEIALWYSFACNNVADYEHYYQAAQWMPSSEKNAGGCGAWYYRYAYALIYCGRLPEALRYAEQGVREEPDYPWGWGQLGKLRSHFGDKEGALEAAERGLLLEPGDYGYLTLRKEIREGRTLEEMEYHYIDPAHDQELQRGTDEDAYHKQDAIRGIVCDPDRLEQIKSLFGFETWEADCPYCIGTYTIQGSRVELVFRMNEAYLSKADVSWLKGQKKKMDGEVCIRRPDEAGEDCLLLDTVLFDRDQSVSLIYKNEKENNCIRIPLEENMESREENKSNTGSFVGFVLLSENNWNKEQLIWNLRENWNLMLNEEDEGSDALIFREGEMTGIVSLMPAPVPDGEAERNAENNYMWPEAVDAAENHKAHLMVAVLGQEAGLLERGKLFVQLMSGCAAQEYATGVYTSGTVFEPRLYQAFAEMIKEGELPIFNWIWFGLYRNEKGICGYTYGMDVFGKDEMEVLDADAEPSEVRNFLANMVSYVLEYDVTLKDGETIGFSAEQKLPITRSAGVSLPGMTLKIGYGGENL